MYLYVDCLEREINIPQVCANADEARKLLFTDFLDAKGIDDEVVINFVEMYYFDDAMEWLNDNEVIDDENDISYENPYNMYAYAETRNHDNWDAKVFRLETTELSVSIKA